ncbi:hypothetical protein AVEN_89199-1 [Araneus ventricosus]|uniref:Uncharacterized protein n=1 Tax=Araneus ventricosus TaxID=182803 RepID=A0A4Y2GRN8_ARAVE|nr:hypothetical protein AVEN_89199-1 [Araneus ventricosus]
MTNLWQACCKLKLLSGKGAMAKHTFASQFEIMLGYFEKYSQILSGQVDRIFSKDTNDTESEIDDDDDEVYDSISDEPKLFTQSELNDFCQEEKLKKGVFVGPDIRKMMKDDNFESKMETNERKAWKSFKVITSFLGNKKDPNYKSIVEEMIKNFKIRSGTLAFRARSKRSEDASKQVAPLTGPVRLASERAFNLVARRLAEWTMEDGVRPKNSLAVDGEGVFFRFGGRNSAPVLNGMDISVEKGIMLVFFQVFVPVFQVIVFCLCVGGEPFDLPMAVVNLETDPSGKSNAFLQTISPTTFIQVPL